MIAVVTAFTSALAAGSGSWFGYKYRADGIEARMDDGFANVRDDLRRVEGKVDHTNGRVQDHTVDIARHDDRITWLERQQDVWDD